MKINILATIHKTMPINIKLIEASKSFLFAKYIENGNRQTAVTNRLTMIIFKNILRCLFCQLVTVYQLAPNPLTQEYITRYE